MDRITPDPAERARLVEEIARLERQWDLTDNVMRDPPLRGGGYPSSLRSQARVQLPGNPNIPARGPFVRSLTQDQMRRQSELAILRAAAELHAPMPSAPMPAPPMTPPAPHPGRMPRMPPGMSRWLWPLLMASELSGSTNRGERGALSDKLFNREDSPEPQQPANPTGGNSLWRFLPLR